MASVVSSFEMAVIDRNCEFLGISRRILMENAGRGVAEVVKSKFPDVRRVCVVAGLGDNGGDGVVAGRYLHNWGLDVRIILLGREQDVRSELLLENLQIVKTLGIEVVEVVSSLELYACSDLIVKWPDVVIDAIIGTGLRGALREPQYSAVRLINLSGARKIAVDVPSGLDPDTGRVTDAAVKADITVTMHKPKPGLLREEAKKYVGELVVVDIGIPPEAEHVVGPGDLLYLNWRRRKESKKGDHGRVVIIGGSREFTGAPVLAALAAYRTGVDLVTIVAPGEAAHDMRSQNPNLIVVPVEGGYFKREHVDKVLRYCEKADVVLIGPGLGLEQETLHFVVDLLSKLTSINKKTVLDADAVKAVGQLEAHSLLNANVIVTSHAGEFKTLIGDVPRSSNPWKRGEETCKLVAEKLGSRKCVVVLKGNIDVMTDGINYKINLTGNPAMTVGGTGDIFAGTVTAMFTKVRDPLEAAAITAFIVGLAGDYATQELGYHILPTDLLDIIPRIMKKLLDEDSEIRKILHAPSLRLLNRLRT